MAGLFSCASDATNNDPWGTIIFMVVIIALFVVMMYFNRRSQKKRQEETEKLLSAIKPGNKVKTIGGICGIVVEVCHDDNTFILETGTEKSGKSFIKFDMQAIYQTDAVAPTATEEKPKEEKKDEEPKAVEATEEVLPVEEPNEAAAEAPAPVEEAVAEEKPVKKTTRKKESNN